MANPEHLEILKQGAEVWNKWREENPLTKPELNHANLFGMNLNNANLSLTNLSGTNLNAAILNLTNLSEANLSSADLSESKLYYSDLNLADLCSSNLSRATLTRSKLIRADLRWAKLDDSNFSSADLREAYLIRTVLRGADLRSADLSEADLREANITDSHLDGTTLEGTMIGGTIFGNVDLSNAKGLESVSHRGPSTVGIDTIYRSGGKIPEVFLRGCGVPENFIQYMSSLTGKAFEYYSCFISYSSKNQDFADRLHADLQNKGVRCWFAPEDMKIGDKIRDRIDQSIIHHDKLLMILSENSINSEWVEDESEVGYEKERQKGKTVLFPIRLDSAVMDTDKAWAAKLRRSRHIGDFTRWKDHDSYQKAFDRLMRDLKAEEPAGSE